MARPVIPSDQLVTWLCNNVIVTQPRSKPTNVNWKCLIYNRELTEIILDKCQVVGDYTEVSEKVSEKESISVQRFVPWIEGDGTSFS